MITVVVDTLGGDRSPDAAIAGAVMALEKLPELSVILTGDKSEIFGKLSFFDYDTARVSVVHAPDVISCNESPTKAIRSRTESSLYKAFELLKNDENVNALVSTGSTGAILAGSVLKLGRIKGVKLPALCPILPTARNSIVGICDSGANVDCDAAQLLKFAVMGALYLEKAYGIKNPRVKLLNIGTEEEKGDAVRKEAFRLLSEADDLNFTGNMEARELLSGDCDLVVCDGFSGNVLLKSTEGACLEMLGMLKRIFTSSAKNKLGALILKDEIAKTAEYMDYNNYGGAVLLGSAKTVVKGHGSSKDVTVMHCIEQAYNMEKNGLIPAITSGIAELKK